MFEPKARGEYSEMLFLLEATKRGFVVSKPFGDNQCYDFILDDKKGNLFRVQVKSTLNKKKIHTKQKNPSKPYPLGAFEFFAMLYENNWWLIPLALINDKIGISLSPRYSAFKNNWNLGEYFYGHKKPFLERLP